MAAWAVAIDESNTGTMRERVAVVALQVDDLEHADWVLRHWRDQILTCFDKGPSALIFHHACLFKPASGPLGRCKLKRAARTRWIRHWLSAIRTRLFQTKAILTRAKQPPTPVALADLAASALQETLALIASRGGSTANIYRETGTWTVAAPVHPAPALAVAPAAPVHVLTKVGGYRTSLTGMSAPQGVPALLGLADYVASWKKWPGVGTSRGPAICHVVAQRLHGAIAPATTVTQIDAAQASFIPTDLEETLAHQSLDNFKILRP